MLEFFFIYISTVELQSKKMCRTNVCFSAAVHVTANYRNTIKGSSFVLFYIFLAVIILHYEKIETAKYYRTSSIEKIMFFLSLEVFFAFDALNGLRKLLCRINSETAKIQVT